MFTERIPQGDFFETARILSPDLLERLGKTWAVPFKTDALELIDETAFACMYSKDMGRPNKPVQTVVGILVLKEMFDMTDQEALDSLQFDLRWHVAPGLTPAEAYCCQKTLHNFRVNLIKHELGRVLFQDTTDRILTALGVSTSKQRQDSTHIVSNMAILTRFGLFCETIRVFLREVRRDYNAEFTGLSSALTSRYLKDDGAATRYNDARSSVAKRRLNVCGRNLWRLIDAFRSDEVIAKLDGYKLLERLFEEQCEVVGEAPTPAEGDPGIDEPPAPVTVKKPKEVAADSLQSPHDKDATYSGHKGKGYEAQLAETFGNEDTPEIITHAEVTQSCGSDANALEPALDDLDQRGIAPDQMAADTTYGSTTNAIDAAERGVELISPVSGPKKKTRDDGVLSLADSDVDAAGTRKTRCPEGCEAVAETRADETVRAEFDGAQCESCHKRGACPAKPNSTGNRAVKLNLHKAVLETRRRYAETEEFVERYAPRAGIEGTNSELKRRHGLGKLRVRGGPRVGLALHLKALACNIKRMVNHVQKTAKTAEVNG